MKIGRRVTAEEVAKAVGVSRATVGFVLNDTPGQSISEDTRRRVLTAALQLGYRPNSAAQALARGYSDIVLLVLPDWPIDDVMHHLLTEIALALDEAGYTLVAWSPHVSGAGRPLWELIPADLVMGMAPFDAEQVAALHANGVAIFPEPDDPGQSGHGGGRFAAGPRLQVDHLADLGHRRIAYARPADPRLAFLAGDRFRLVHEQAGRRGLHVVDDRVTDLGSAAAAVRDWLNAGCTAVVAYNDYVASVVTGAALRAGVAVPDELSIIGHDDSPLAEVFVPSLTTVRINLRAIAQEVAAFALRKIAGAPAGLGDGPAIAATLVPRESTATPARNAVR
ncbi:LacI family transcriptional regulator [Amycolatopsis sp. K13G38]|uniref:LacI family transcriptional regulator n=1 Tax=Amycolatopsis acididurans TaxID=2724524 RepID=A0ABX1IVS2_9PSEU|nr:LacI family DNA-binding transcriptional regulator [Amycolatopsis acididurans]NKQ51587.1 LacI family transcriptional regulator [Amycolatopsis acididurans]